MRQLSAAGLLSNWAIFYGSGDGAAILHPLDRKNQPPGAQVIWTHQHFSSGDTPDA